MNNNLKSYYKITEGNRSFTSFVFYNELLPFLMDYYGNPEQYKATNKPPSFVIDEGSFIDPVCLPLLLSLGDYLCKFHDPAQLIVVNNQFTLDVLLYLKLSGFFEIAASPTNDPDSLGRDLFRFDQNAIGGMIAGKERLLKVANHKVRFYELSAAYNKSLKACKTDDERRDYLMSLLAPKVEDDFLVLADDIEGYSSEKSYELINTLSELVTNAIWHSDEGCYTMVQNTNYNTVVSVSDLGIGLYDSLNAKKDSVHFYRKFDLLNSIVREIDSVRSSNGPGPQVSDVLKSESHAELVNVLAIFEALFYSMIKSRTGLLDLILNVVFHGEGVVRIHNVSAQVVLSNRFVKVIEKIVDCRMNIRRVYHKEQYGKKEGSVLKESLGKLIPQAQQLMLDLSLLVLKSSTFEIKLSPVRMYPVKFRGVHIEIEIPRL